MSKNKTAEMKKSIKKNQKDNTDDKETKTSLIRLKSKPVAIKLTKDVEDEEQKVRYVHKKVQIEVSNDNKFDLDDMASIEYYDDFITQKFHNDLFDELTNNVPWTHGIYNMYGKVVQTPRLLYCMRDKDFDVTKVYKVTDSMEWTKNMLKLKKMVEKKTNKIYSYAQLNYYRTGDDYIGYHTDSEIQDGDVIASVSLGASRKFTFRQIDYKENDSNIYTMDLEPRSLILMNEYAAKKRWKHELPKMKNVQDVRINITFRPK
jgi:alkylated DNA repair dioxygenase AlkB